MDRPRRSARKRAHDAADTEQQEQEQATRGLIPTEEDIILGRGVKHVGKTGNARYYELLDWFLPAFDAADTKGAKTAIVRSIYDQLQNGGARFLKYDTRSGYYSIDPRHGKKDQPRASVSQAASTGWRQCTRRGWRRNRQKRGQRL
eukprot:scaffold1853_cov185-Amphora_coffeaeformis.AAC.3